MIHLGKTIGTMVLFIGLAVPAVAQTAAANAAPSATVARYFACTQSDSIPVPSSLPHNAPPPQWVVDKMNATMHANGHTCFTITGGTAGEQKSLALQTSARLAAAERANGVRPNTYPTSCTDQDYFASYTDQNVVSGVNVNVSVHYREQATCTHLFYYNNYVIQNGAAQPEWKEAQDCSYYADPRGCTSDETSGNGNGQSMISPGAYAYFAVTETNSVDQLWIGYNGYCFNGCPNEITTSDTFTTN